MISYGWGCLLASAARDFGPARGRHGSHPRSRLRELHRGPRRRLLHRSRSSYRPDIIQGAATAIHPQEMAQPGRRAAEVRRAQAARWANASGPWQREEAAGLKALFADAEVIRAISGLTGSDAKNVALVDAAYWLKGCSSLGRLRSRRFARNKSAFSRPDRHQGSHGRRARAASQALDAARQRRAEW